MRDKKAAVNVVSEDGRELVVEAEDGKQTSYYRDPIRTMSLTVDQLSVSYTGSADNLVGPVAGEPPALSLQVYGTASLDRRSISIIGDPKSKTSIIGITFHALDETSRKQKEALALEKDEEPQYANARLGFIRSDWEIGNGDEWYLTCEMLPSVLATLADTVTDGTLRKMGIGLSLHHIYSDDDWAPPSAKTDWFLRPNSRDNTIEFPDDAYGTVRNLSLITAEVDLRRKAAPDELESDYEDEPQPPPPDQTAVALNGLARNIETLHGTLKLLGWLVVGALVILAFK